MTRRAWTGFGIAATAACLAAALTGRAGAQGAPTGGSPLRIGVVNVKDCLDPAKYEYNAEVEAELKKRQKELQEELAKKERNYKEIQDKMDAVSDKNSQLYVDLVKQLLQAEKDYELTKSSSQKLFYYEAVRARLQIYKAIDAATDQVARQLKLDLVLRAGEPAEVQQQEMMLRVLSQQVVLYHDPALDVTKDVLAKLNEEYRKGKPSNR